MAKGSSIGEFVLDIFIDGAKGELTVGNLIKSMGALNVVSVGQIAILEAVANRLIAVMNAAVGAAAGLEEYTSGTGASITKLQEWAAAGKLVDIPVEEMGNALAHISAELQKLKSSGHSGLDSLAATIGINLFDFDPAKPEKLLKALRERLKVTTLTAAAEKDYLTKAGLGRVHRVLTSKEGGISEAEFKQAGLDRGILSEKDVKDFEAIHKQITQIESLAVHIGDAIARWVAPATLEFLNKEIEALRVIASFMDRSKPQDVKDVLLDAAKRGEALPILNLIPGGLPAGKLIEGILNTKPTAPTPPGYWPTYSTDKGTPISYNVNAPITIDGSRDPVLTAEAVAHHITSGLNLNMGNRAT